MDLFLKVIIVSFAITETSCSIGGLNYMKTIDQRPLPNDARRNEELYWYPKAVPEYYNQKFTLPCGPRDPLTTPSPIRVPIPVPSIPLPYPVPFPPPMSMPYPLPPPPLPMIPMPIPPLPYGIPIMPAGPMLPVGGLPLPAMAPFPGMFPAQFPGVFPAQFPAPPLPAEFGPQAGLVPGIRGLVSPEGGINIMPFSDAYSNMLEEHKQKMIRKHMEHVLEKYGERVNYGKRKRKSRRW